MGALVECKKLVNQYMVVLFLHTKTCAKLLLKHCMQLRKKTRSAMPKIIKNLSWRKMKNKKRTAKHFQNKYTPNLLALVMLLNINAKMLS